MFSSDSRYRRSRLVTGQNQAGRPIKAVELRIPPPTGGQFLHRIQEGDRIDSLAHKYYRAPRRWWRIADANPSFPTPDRLLGRSPLVTERIRLTPPGPTARWAQAIAAASALAGVIAVTREQEHTLSVEQHTVAGEVVDVIREQVEDAVRIVYNELVVEPAELLAVFASFGFTAAGREPISRVGQPIVIPPEGA